MQPKLKKKTIEIFLQDTPDFDILEKGTFRKEQHLTPPSLAAEALHKIYQMENIMDSRVCDLGCGTGMLISGLLYMGAEYALGVDFDAKYAAIAQELIQDKFEGEVNFDVLCVDVSKWNTEKMRGFFDVVVMNPPFGTKEQGMDYVFLTKAFEICKGNVYSFHKTCTNEFLQKKAVEHKKKFEVLQTINYPINKRYAKYHKYDSLDILVDFVCFSNQP